MSNPPPASGTLFLVATPIGHLGDLTARAREVLAGVSAIACEDTRRTHKLLSALGIPRPQHLFSCHDHNEDRSARRIEGLLAAGVDVALVSDAGSPLVSDPGYLVLQRILDADLPVVVVPGPSSAIAALSLSGLPSASFTVLGFLPRRPGRLARALEAEATSPHTLVIFESPFRLARLLEAVEAALGDRRAAVAVELTKLHERVLRGRVSELRREVEGLDRRGEVTVVVEGLSRRAARDDEEP